MALIGAQRLSVSRKARFQRPQKPSSTPRAPQNPKIPRPSLEPLFHRRVPLVCGPSQTSAASASNTSSARYSQRRVALIGAQRLSVSREARFQRPPKPSSTPRAPQNPKIPRPALEPFFHRRVPRVCSPSQTSAASASNTSSARYSQSNTQRRQAHPCHPMRHPLPT